MRSSLLCALLLAGCATTEPDPTDTQLDTDGVATDDGDGTETDASSDTDPVDTEVDWTGFTPDGIEAELTDVVTVIRVTWTTTEVTTGYVEFGEDTDYGWVTPLTDAGTEHEVLLLGNGADRDIHFRVVTREGEVELASEDNTLATGTLPAELPELTVEGEVEHWQGYQVAPTQGTGTGMVIFDTRGEVVWYYTTDEVWNVMKAVVTPDGQVAIGLAGMAEDLDRGVIRYVSMDGSSVEDLSVPYFDHDFTMLPDGSMAAIVVVRNFCCTELADSIVEIGADGTMTTIWDAWEELDYETYNTGGNNWTHGNALDYVEEEDAYYISLKDMGTIAKVDRSTGTTQWLLNGAPNQFIFPDGEFPVSYQHQFERTDDGILIFANELSDVDESQAVELTLDEDAMTATYAWRYGHDPALNIYAKGDVHVLDDDAVQVVWSTSGEIENVTRDGDVVWRLNTSLGYAFTFTTFAETLYATE